MRCLPTSACEHALYMYISFRCNSKFHISVGSYHSCRCRLRKCGCVEYCDLASGWIGRRISDNLKVTRYKPVLIDRVVGLCRDNVDTEVVGLAVSEHRYEGREVNEILW